MVLDMALPSVGLASAIVATATSTSRWLCDLCIYFLHPWPICRTLVFKFVGPVKVELPYNSEATKNNTKSLCDLLAKHWHRRGKCKSPLRLAPGHLGGSWKPASRASTRIEIASLVYSVEQCVYKSTEANTHLTCAT